MSQTYWLHKRETRKQLRPQKSREGGGMGRRNDEYNKIKLEKERELQQKEKKKAGLKI